MFAAEGVRPTSELVKQAHFSLAFFLLRLDDITLSFKIYKSKSHQRESKAYGMGKSDSSEGVGFHGPQQEGDSTRAQLFVESTSVRQDVVIETTEL